MSSPHPQPSANHTTHHATLIDGTNITFRLFADVVDPVTKQVKDHGFASFDVPSSDPGNPPYTVIFQEIPSAKHTQQYECSCKGFEYRAWCRHVELVKRWLHQLYQDQQPSRFHAA